MVVAEATSYLHLAASACASVCTEGNEIPALVTWCGGWKQHRTRYHHIKCLFFLTLLSLRFLYLLISSDFLCLPFFFIVLLLYLHLSPTTHIHIHIHVHSYTYIHIHTHIHEHTCTHTHKGSGWR